MINQKNIIDRIFCLNHKKVDFVDMNDEPVREGSGTYLTKNLKIPTFPVVVHIVKKICTNCGEVFA